CISLIHRYTNFSVFLGAKIHPIGMSQTDAYAFWDTLQRYMDVTQPLPDLPILEQSRHLDPVTAEHDRKTNRNPRLWRDLDLKAWNQRIASNVSQRNQNVPWQKEPCILRERVNSELSIADYYEAQEARGIAATPKAKDFEDDRGSPAKKAEIEA